MTAWQNPNAVGGLEAGNALVVVTCPRGREGQCVNECYDLFAEVSPLAKRRSCRKPC